jgi:malonyl-CoA/methylmalonyl-CoA synthetase
VNLFAAYAERFPADDVVLLTTPDAASYTYGDALQESARVANCLAGLGLKPGDRVTVQAEKSVELLWLFLGCLRAGLVYHPLNTAYTDDEVRYFLEDAGTSLLVCDGARVEALRGLCDSLGVSRIETLEGDGGGSLAAKVASCPADFDTVDRAGGDVASLVYSSGTSGRPKGIMLSHGNLIANASVLVDYWGFSGNDCLLHALPVFHVHGLFVALGCVFMSGASMRWLPKFEVDAVLQELPHATTMMGVPTFYTRLLAEPAFNREACAGMRLFISGSAPLLAETHREFEQRTGHAILERYGMTETGMNTSNPLEGERRAGTVGPPLPGVDVRVCDENDRELPRGEVGELQVKGPNVFVGYWNMPDKTAEDFTGDGYFRTGDQARIDDSGYVSIVGRAKDMVITGGLNVYPKEVEMVLDTVPGVAESAVIGLPDADFGEAVVAVVVAEKRGGVSEEAIREAARAQLAAFKVPKRVIFVDQLPRNTMGKVQKAALRRTYGA